MVEPSLQSVATTRSPALRGFELNPFRVLRLPVNASTHEATFQADSALTLARVGLPPEEEDPLPWLPPAEPHDLQRAAQAVEEPLVRLKQQLLWFDFVRDERAAVLASALRDPRGPVLQQYLQEELVPGETPCDVTRIAHAVNQANLRLLLAASLVSNAVAVPSSEPAKSIAPDLWRTLHGLSVLPKAHEILVGGLAGGDTSSDARAYWSGGLKRWVRILSHPRFHSYLGACIADLGDDFTSADDAETLEASLRTHLADLSAQETRVLLLEGRYPLAASMIAAVAESGLDVRVLGPAMRPLRHVMQSEISELQPLLDAPEDEDMGTLEAYLKRLGAIRQRWQRIDPSGIIGLLDVIDEAVEQVYLRLRNRRKPAEKLDSLLGKVGEIATARSLRTRMSASRAELKEIRTQLCYFCESEPLDLDKSVVIKGKKETRREYHFNRTTVHYAVRLKILRRCARCARFHGYLRTIEIGSMIGAAPSCAGVALLLLSAIEDWTDMGCFLVLPLLGVIGAVVAIGSACRSLLVRRLTPTNHRRYGDYKDSEEAKALGREGYSLEADWSSTAVKSLKNQMAKK